jgi:hypothetical protein
MNWLTAALAFALSMIVFSTVVSALTEAMHGIFQMRARGLRRLLEQVYDEHLAERLGPALDRGKDELKRQYLERLTRNYGVEIHGPLGAFGRWFTRRGVDSLTTLEFARRLAETEVGRLLRARAGAEIVRLVDGAGQRFERFGADASSYFRARAQLISALAAVALAFALNIDAVRLFSSFLVDHELAAQVIAQAPEIEHAHLSSSGTTPRGSQPATTPESMPQPPAPGDAAPPEEDAAAADDPTANLGAQLAATAALGLPIGRAYYPWCDAAASPTRASPDLRCREASNGDATQYAAARRLLGWLLSTLLAGVLIGLGGPFWFDAFKRLSVLVDLRRTLLGGQPAAQAGAPAPPAKTAPTPAQAFNEASLSSKPLPRSARRLLTSDGHPVRQGGSAWKSR